MNEKQILGKVKEQRVIMTSATYYDIEIPVSI